MVSFEELSRLRAEYTAVTGKVGHTFVCPISLRDEPDAELCDGHILNHGLGSASRITVVQRKDIDNYYGHTVEPDLVRLLNLGVETQGELIHRSHHLHVVTPEGGRVETFFASPRSGAGSRFKQVDLLGEAGEVIARPFLRGDGLAPGRYTALDVEWTVTVRQSSIVASFVKAAYLALVRMFGYRWVVDDAGSYVRRALLGFYEDGHGKEAAREHFGRFEGLTSVVVAGSDGATSNSLADNTFLLHYAAGDGPGGVLYALSCIFYINGRTWTVSLPACDPGYFFVALPYYEAFLKDRSLPSRVHQARLADGRLEVSEVPLSFHYRKELAD
jgi:hypothetical protein